MLIYEDNRACRSLIRKSHNFLRTVDFHHILTSDIKDFFPPKRIIDTAHFVEKTDTSLIQLADVCAFVVKRRLMKTPESEELFASLLGQMAVRSFVTAF